jgi:hypothetical protein
MIKYAVAGFLRVLQWRARPPTNPPIMPGGVFFRVQLSVSEGLK